MMALRLQGLFLAFIDIAINSRGSFCTPCYSMATICPYHQPHHGPLSGSCSREREGLKWWFGSYLWFPLFLPSAAAAHPPGPRIPWLTDNGTKLLSTHLCVSHVLLEAPPQLWWIIWDAVTGAHGHSALWLCLASARAESIACPRRAQRGQARLCWDLSSLFPLARRDQACLGGPV